ncbi:NUBP iron-sulfur cluster assembly factor 2 isoform X2 [Tachypleus tridentatus]
MLNLEEHEVHQCPEGWVPIFVDQKQTLAIMSIGFLLRNRNDPVIWRGPKKNAMIKQFLTDVYWQDIDYLIIDTPPGTSDEHISVVETLKEVTNIGAILVTTPQAVAVGDVRRELTFCKKTGIPVLGIIENMSGFVCPSCCECSNVFSKGGGEALAKQSDVPFLGSIPLDLQLSKCLEKGEDFMNHFEQSVASQAFSAVAALILKSNTEKL